MPYKGKEPKWIVVGGSYAGALSAWFRYKFPHLAVGALSSSGVVVPLIKFDKFDQQVVTDYKEDDECYKIVKEYHDYIKAQLKDENARKDSIKHFEPCNNLTDTSKITKEEFFFYFADINALYPQYSMCRHICSFLKEIRSKKPGDVKGQLLEYCHKAYKEDTTL